MCCEKRWSTIQIELCIHSRMIICIITTARTSICDYIVSCFWDCEWSNRIYFANEVIMRFTFSTVVVIFILRRIKIITSQYPGQNMLKYFPLSVLPRNLIRINFRIRVIMFLLIDKYMIQITLETKNYCLLVVIIVLDGEYHYLYHQKHHITIMDLEWF